MKSVFNRYDRSLLLLPALFLGALALYTSTMSRDVNFIDSGELIAALWEPGIAHPPGYPLYVLMGYVVSHIMPGPVAWRVNFVSAFFGAAAVAAFYLLVKTCASMVLEREATPRPPAPKRKGSRRPEQAVASGSARVTRRPVLPTLCGLAATVLLASSETFWSRTAQAKMYSLHYFFVAVILLLATNFRRRLAENESGRGTAAILASAIGLSLSNHLMTLLVLPSAGLILALPGPGSIARKVRSYWRTMLPILLIPVVLYLYLPLRASQHPVMNWGSPDNWGDFWRHVRGWQYQVYLFGSAGENFSRLLNFASEQWARLTAPVFILSFGGASVLAKRTPALLLATVVLAIATLIFAISYGISELEPYIVPFYMVVTLWAGLSALAPVVLIGSGVASAITNKRKVLATMLTGCISLIGVLSVIGQYADQDRSEDHLARQFVENVFTGLPKNSLVITDYWDFYAPTYYLQQIEGLRPDVVIVDKSLLRYPWYSAQLAKRYPSLIEKSIDILTSFRREQAKWVNGERFDARSLDASYYGLLSSFVERNIDEKSAFLLLQPPCEGSVLPPECDGNRIAEPLARQKIGLVTRLTPAGMSPPKLPALPDYRLDGIVGSTHRLDDFARENSRLYAVAFASLAEEYERAGNLELARLAASKARSIYDWIRGR